jgi:hypothetical protein
MEAIQQGAAILNIYELCSTVPKFRKQTFLSINEQVVPDTIIM